MTYETVMVNMRLGHANSDLLRLTSTIVRDFNAGVIGLAACQLAPMINSDGYSPGPYIAEESKAIGAELDAAEAEFKHFFASRGKDTRWLSATLVEPVADFVSRVCHSADLVITTGLSFDRLKSVRSNNPAGIVMQAGRPVLIVPSETSTNRFDRVVIAWKNTREARRAVADAVPLMKKATLIHVVEIAPEDQRVIKTQQLSEVCSWLETHDIVGRPMFVPRGKGDDGYQLNKVVQKLDTDLVVAGAYGHNRFREWALGGVTEDLTLQAEYCTLLAH